MKKLLILTRFEGEYEPRRLAAAARARDWAAAVFNYERVGLGWETGKTEIFLPEGRRPEEFTAVVMRSGGHYGKRSLSGLKTALIKAWPKSARVLNRESFEQWPMIGKTEQGVMLAKAGVAVIPSWWWGPRGETEAFWRKASYPLVVKGRFGSHSKKTFRAENREGVEGKLGEGEEFFIQKLIKSRWYWRVLVLGGRVLGRMRRETNAKLLAGGEPWELNDKELDRLALTATAAFKAQMAGVDILATGNHRGAVIEVNRSPQFKIFEKKEKGGVAEAVIDLLKKEK